MPKLFIRIVAFLLVPCLMMDPISISAMEISGRHGGLPIQFPFTSQALAPLGTLVGTNPFLTHPNRKAEVYRFEEAAAGLAEDSNERNPNKTTAGTAALSLEGINEDPKTIETRELFGPLVEEIERLADSVAIIVGSLFGLPIEMIQRVRAKIKIRVFASSAQSSAAGGVIYICLSGSINTLEKTWRLLRTIAAEVGHCYHQILVESRPGSTAAMADGVKEVFDAAARIGLVAAVDFRKVNELRRELQPGFGRDLLAALKALKKRPEQFSGAPTKLSRQVLHRIASAMKSKHTIEFIAWRLGDIAADFFKVLPEEPGPLPYGAHHRIAGGIFGDLLWTICRKNPWLAVRVVGQTLLENPFHFTSVGRFSSLLKRLALSVSRSTANEIEKLEPAVAHIRQVIQSIESRPLIVPSTEINSADEHKWRKVAELVEDLVGQVMSEHFPNWRPDRVHVSPFHSIPIGLSSIDRGPIQTHDRHSPSAKTFPVHSLAKFYTRVGAVDSIVREVERIFGQNAEFILREVNYFYGYATLEKDIPKSLPELTQEYERLITFLEQALVQPRITALLADSIFETVFQIEASIGMTATAFGWKNTKAFLALMKRFSEPNKRFQQLTLHRAA